MLYSQSFYRLRFLSFLTICLFVTQISFSQKKDENIGTEVVNVVKSYTPAISDASKIKEIPTLDEEEISKKESIKYTIFSFPVASTFTPYKGNPEAVEKEKRKKYFKNYTTFAGGNYGVLNGELFVNHDLNSTDYVGAMLSHFSSQGGIKDVELSDNYNQTNLELTFGTHRKNLSWNLDFGYQNQIYNWYGLPVDFGSSLVPIEKRTTLLNEINEQQRYNSLYVGTRMNFNKGILNDASLKFNRFSDAFGSTENRLCAKPTFGFEFKDKYINTTLVVDYLQGSFVKEYDKTNPLNYGFTNIGIAPSFEVKEKGWTVQIGAAIFYSLAAETATNQLLLYPKIKASIDLVDDLMVFYTGLDGNLEQNTYSDFVAINPFVSPTLQIAPTDKQFDVFAGLKGKLTHAVSYNMKASYVNESNKALFKSNVYYDSMYDDSAFDVKGYHLGNSFNVVYDDIKTLGFSGELKAEFSEKIKWRISGTINSYKTTNEMQAWNLPQIKWDSKIDYVINEKWYAGVNVFYVGQRKDIKYVSASLDNNLKVVKNLEGYFDINAHAGFQYSDRLTAFLRANNIANNSFQKWLNYPVQALQVVLGVNYKFDF